MTLRAASLTLAIALGATLSPTAFAHDKAAAPSVEQATVDFSGTYTWEQQGGGGGGMTTTLVLKQDGTKLTGTITGRGGETAIEDGSVDGKTLKFNVTREWNGNKMVTQYSGTVTETGLKLTQTTSRDIEAKKSE